jgi:hypothetical protein
MIYLSLEEVSKKLFLALAFACAGCYMYMYMYMYSRRLKPPMQSG